MGPYINHCTHIVFHVDEFGFVVLSILMTCDYGQKLVFNGTCFVLKASEDEAPVAKNGHKQKAKPNGKAPVEEDSEEEEEEEESDEEESDVEEAAPAAKNVCRALQSK